MKTDPVEGAARRKAKAHRNRLKFAEWAIVLLIVTAGAAIRMQYLDERPFWVDEAESSINALTILEHGYPTDTYLGIPIYENTHVWLWPDNPEYEFRDVSYSENHFAVYHGWLPLYAIAASFAVYGIEPDHAGGSLVPKHDLVEQKRRTKAARLPAVFFAALFLVAVFLGGKALYGSEAGWAALMIGAIYPYHLQVSNQARYYSAQVTLTTACCVLLWLVVKECKWTHVVLAGVSFVLLFHTHLLSFLTAAVMAGISLPVVMRRHRDWLKKMILFGALVAAGSLPWVIITRFYDHQSRIPRAWPFLRIPADLLIYPPFRLWTVIPGLLILIVVVLVYVNRERVSREVTDSAERLDPVILFLGGWAMVGYVAFLLLIPAVSLSASRVNLSYWGPLFLLASAMCAALARILRPRFSHRASAVLTSLLMLGFFFATRTFVRVWQAAGTRLVEDLWRGVAGSRLNAVGFREQALILPQTAT